MDRAIFRQATERQATSEKKARSLLHVRDLQEAKEAWSDFLVAHCRMFNRFSNAMENIKERGWIDKVLHERKADPLLQYLHQARNADEHGRLEIAAPEPARIEIGARGAELHINRLVMWPNGIMFDGWEGEAKKPATVHLVAATLRLTEVTNNGVVYPVPSKHGGKNIAADPATFARLGAEFGRRALTEAASKFP